LADLELRDLRRNVAPASALPPQATAAARESIDDTGFNFSSGDGQTYINLHGFVQADTRWFFDNHRIANNNTFVIRRARLIYELAFDKVFTY